VGTKHKQTLGSPDCPLDLYYKPITIINDDSSVLNKLETSLIGNARVIFDNRHMFIIQAIACFVLCPLLALAFQSVFTAATNSTNQTTRKAVHAIKQSIFLGRLWAQLGRVQVNNQVGNGK
jgi:hypothetical protein